MAIAFIYELSHPSSDKKYIGQTIALEKRYKLHLRSWKFEKNNYKDNWIKSLLNKGLKPEMKVIARVDRKQVDFFEIFFIDLYQRLGFKLVNGTLGGSNNSGGMTEETKKKIGDGNRGKVRTPEQMKNCWDASAKYFENTPLKHRIQCSTRMLGNTFRNGKAPSNKGFRKYSEEQVKEMKTLMDLGVPVVEISKRFDIKCMKQLSAIRKGTYFLPEYISKSSRDSWKNQPKENKRKFNRARI